MIKLAINLLLLTSFATFAKVETNQKVEVLARSFPIGGFSKFTYEAILPLWGDRAHPKDISYGFYGAKIEYRTSVIVNYFSSQAFIYPIPILGIFAGAEKGEKSIKNIHTFDCDQVQCNGGMERKFIGLKLALAYKDYFLMSENRWSDVKSLEPSNKYFVDEITTLLGSPNADQTWVSLNIIGKKIDDDSKIGGIFLFNNMSKNRSKSSMISGFYERSWKSHSLISSFGIFQTRQHQSVGTLLFLYSWKTPSAFRLF